MRFATEKIPDSVRIAGMRLRRIIRHIKNRAGRNMTDRQIYVEMDRQLLGNPKPSEYFNSLGGDVYGIEPFEMLGRLKNTQQSPEHHPEGSVWNHTMLVLDEAAARKDGSTDVRVFMWAALLHDLGKPGTTSVRRGRITSYDHDRLGERLAMEFLRHFGESEAFAGAVGALVRFHMHILYVVRSMPFAKVSEMRRRTNVRDVALLGLCDRLGRTGVDRQEEEENIRLFIEKSEGPGRGTAV